MTVRAIKPIEITSAMVVASTLFETAPATYAAGTTYALGVYASVAGLLGEILIYKSLRVANIGNTPATSPTWWFLSSKTYAVYNPLTKYPLGYRVVDTTTHRVKESLRNDNTNRPVDNALPWKHIGEINYPIATPFHSTATTYALDALVIGWINSSVDFIDHNIYGLMRSKAAGNLGNATDQTPPGPTIPPTPYTGNSWWAIMEYVYPKFNVFAVYSKGEKVTDTDGKIYECQISDTNRQPLTNAVQWWLDVAPSNATAFQDGEVSTQSVANGDMEFTITTGVIDTLALVGIQGGTATVTVRDGLGGTVGFEQTQGISGEIVADWYSFTYGDAAIPLRKVVFSELPPYVNAHVTIKIVGDGEVKLGAIAAGVQANIGIGASYGANIEVKDYSVKTTDEFGKTKFVKRGYKEVLEISVLLDKTSFNQTHNALINLRSTPWFLIVSDDGDLSEALYMYGFYNSYRNVIDYPTATIYSLQFESLVS